MSTHNYQTFGGGGIIPEPVTGRQGDSRSRWTRHSLAKLGFFAFSLIAITFLVLGPITALVAFVKLQLLSDGQPATVTHPPTLAKNIKTFMLQILPVRVSYASTHGENCEYNVYTYGGTIPGPKIEIDPGERFRVIVTNNLGPNLKNSTKVNNEFRFGNTTTTHFHGLHASPIGNSDNVFAKVLPGKQFVNEIFIRPDHPSGTYYVHPHQHGSSAMQTGFAMASPLIVRDLDMWWRTRPEEMLVVSRGGINAGHMSNDARFAFSQSEGPGQPSESRCSPDDFILVNGESAEKMTKCDTVVRRWRILNAATDGGLALMWEVDNLAVDNCRLQLIARDGVYLASGIPKMARPNHDVFVVPPGGRIDFLVQRSSPGPGGCRLASVSQPRIRESLGPRTNLMESPIVSCLPDVGATADVKTTGVDPTTVLEAFPVTLPSLPVYMDDLRRYPKAERRVLEYTEFSKAFKRGKAKYGINGEPYTSVSRFSVRLDRVQEWIIVNALAADFGPAQESHPFHLHTNHFQIIGFAGNALHNEDYVVGEWRDTVYVPTPGNLTIRWMPKHFIGKSLLHCHILAHEDEGQSWPFDIVDRLDN